MDKLSIIIILYSVDKWSVVIFINFWASSPSCISEVWTGGPFMCGRQSTLGYMMRCSKQSTITITSLGQVVQFLNSKLYVQKRGPRLIRYFGRDKHSTMLISMVYLSISLILSGQEIQCKKYTCIFNVMCTSGLE